MALALGRLPGGLGYSVLEGAAGAKGWEGEGGWIMEGVRWVDCEVSR